MTYIARHIEKKITELGKEYSVILLTGQRQSGKTTMLRELAEKEGAGRRYVSLDDLGERDLAKTDPALFLQLHEPPVIIDEIQYAPELLTYVKIYADEHVSPGAFWLTGSQIFRLMRGVGESLAGRVAVLHMTPFSQREIAGLPPRPFVPDLDTLLAESRISLPLSASDMYSRIWKGSMPGIVSGRYTDRDVFYSSYVSTYLERDVRELTGDMDILRFNRFLVSAAARTAQLVNYSALAEDADINVQKAKSWLDVLEASGVVFMLHPYSNNTLKRTIKTPKLYFYDTGLVCYLTRWSSPDVAMEGAMSGALLENFVVSEIAKSYADSGLVPAMYFYRDRDAKEIDVILERDGMLHPLEIKKTAAPDKRITRTFSLVGGAFRRGTGGVICLAPKFSALNALDLVVPAWMI